MSKQLQLRKHFCEIYFDPQEDSLCKWECTFIDCDNDNAEIGEPIYAKSKADLMDKIIKVIDNHFDLTKR